MVTQGDVFYIVGLFVFFGGTMARAADLDKWERAFLTKIDATLIKIGLPPKEAAPKLGVNLSNFYRMLNGEPNYNLPFVRMLRRLPLNFWWVLSREITETLIDMHVEEWEQEFARIKGDLVVVRDRLVRRA